MDGGHPSHGPGGLIRLVATVGEELSGPFESADPFAPATFPVAWAGESESPMWFDIAREYTERWHPQRQIAPAVGRRTPIAARHLFNPALDAFSRALPFAYRDVEAPMGTTVSVREIGEAGGDWDVLKEGAGWGLFLDIDGRPTSTVTINQSDAWRLFAKRTERSTARARFPEIRVEGDVDLGENVLEMASVMA